MKEYIERKALPQKKPNGYYINGYYIDIEFNAGWNACLNAIEAIPAADVVEVRHGRWQVGGMFDDIGRCSACHYMFPIDTATTEFHYCPNCGAKMTEV